MLTHSNQSSFGVGTLTLASLLLFLPVPSVHADADDWEDRQEDYEEWLEDQREEAEDRWEDRQEAIEEWREDRGRRWQRLRRRGVIGGRDWYRGYPAFPPPVRYDYYSGPVYHEHYTGPYVRHYRYRKPYWRHYGYDGHVDAGPVHVDYGDRGSVQVGPYRVYWD